ncbi:hypothetical protein GF354_00765 [Candidatus Peregrinibacteria bacterium]|nr:hypothetical protein [Candidatus Peregrinibacteria bacterium]
MEAARLKNGSEEFKPLVQMTMASLSKLAETNPIAFYELVMKCREQGHELFGNTGEVLQSLALIQDERGTVHDSIRNVVLSAVEGDGLDMTLRSPFAEEGK